MTRGFVCESRMCVRVGLWGSLIVIHHVLSDAGRMALEGGLGGGAASRPPPNYMRAFRSSPNPTLSHPNSHDHS